MSFSTPLDLTLIPTIDNSSALRSEPSSTLPSKYSFSSSNLELSASAIQISSTEESMSLGPTAYPNAEIVLSGSGGIFNNSAPTIKLQGGELSASSFFVSSDGEMTASAGKIADWDINGSVLESGGNNIRLDAGDKSISINDPDFGDTGIQLQYIVTKQL